MKLSVIIPAYNEEKRIKKTLLSVDQYLSEQPYDYEILVVNDGSKDGTADVVNDLTQDIRGLKLVDNKINQGKGGAVKDGMLAAKGELRLFMDADNSTTVDQVENFFPYFEGENRCDVGVGSRRVRGAVIAVRQPWIRDFLGGAFRFLVHTLVPLRIADSQAGFKMFTAKAAEAVFRKQTIFRWAFDVEILAIAKKLGLKLKEIPIRWVDDPNSKVKISGMIKMFFEVVQVRLNLWSGKYK